MVDYLLSSHEVFTDAFGETMKHKSEGFIRQGINQNNNMKHKCDHAYILFLVLGQTFGFKVLRRFLSTL